jgi:hypothetical protein
MKISNEAVAEEFKSWQSSKRTAREAMPESLREKILSLTEYYRKKDIERELGLGTWFFGKFGRSRPRRVKEGVLPSKFVKLPAPGEVPAPTLVSTACLEVVLKSGVLVRFY